MGDTNSIDITKAGIDKAYGIGKLRDIMGISLDEMIFVGDALFVGGNEYPVAEAGVNTIAVRGPEETKLVVKAIVACLSPATSTGLKAAPAAGCDLHTRPPGFLGPLNSDAPTFLRFESDTR